MLIKSMFIALLGLILTGCAVHSGGGYGHRGYERPHPTTYYHVPRQTVYVVPHHYRHDKHRYETRRHDGRRHGDVRHAPGYYAPPPAPRYSPSPIHKHRLIQRQAAWDERREHRQERPREHRRDDRRQHRQDAQRDGSWSRSGERHERERRRN